MPQVCCAICRKPFYVKPSHWRLGWGKYCSTLCRSKSQLKGRVVICATCGTDIYRAPRALVRSKSGKFFCSKSCQTLWRNQEFVGDKSNNWKHGLKAYRSILKRSGREVNCLLCNNQDERILTAHHLDHQRSNNNVNNLVWLCLNCHHLVHIDHELDRRLKLIVDGGVCRTV
jgi:hypothetical protein